MVVSNRTTCAFAEEVNAAAHRVNTAIALKTIPIPIASCQLPDRGKCSDFAETFSLIGGCNGVKSLALAGAGSLDVGQPF
jgi:hypothetical protein